MTRVGALRGSAVERGNGRYLLRVHVGGGRYKSRTVAGRTKRELERNWRRFLNELEVGIGHEHGRVRVGDFADAWLAQIERTRTYGTWRRYRAVVRTYVMPTLGHIRLDRLTHADVQHCVDLVVDQAKIATAETLRLVLHGMCKLAVRRGLLTTNPVVDIALPPRQRRDYRVLAVHEAQSLLDVCRMGNARLRQLYPIAHLMLHTGLRRGEALGLRWGAVDFEHRTVDVREQLRRQPGGFGLGPTKTGERRLVFAGEPLMVVLARHKREQDALREQLGPAYADRGFVFTRLDGRARTHGVPIGPNTLSRWFAEALQVAGLPALRIHDLRDTYATLAIAAGVDLVTVSEQLGHSSITMTADRYVHPHSTTKRDTADRLADALAGEYEHPHRKTYEQPMHSTRRSDAV